MSADDLAAYVANFQRRVLQDALAEATSTYWIRRAEDFEAALPGGHVWTSELVAHERGCPRRDCECRVIHRKGDRLVDTPGTESDVARDQRRVGLEQAALACRNRAVVALITGESDATEMVASCLAEVSL